MQHENGFLTLPEVVQQHIQGTLGSITRLH